MIRVDLDQPADLTLWSGHVLARVADARSFPTLRAALAAAADEAIDVKDAEPWIITENGDILAPIGSAPTSPWSARIRRSIQSRVGGRFRGGRLRPATPDQVI